MKRYEDDYRSDPRARRPDPREDRHSARNERDRGDPRERRQIVEDRMDIPDPRDRRGDRMDTVMDTRLPAGRIDPARANDAARRQPPPESRYATDVREQSRPEVYKDPRGVLRDVRTNEIYQPEVARPARGYDDRLDRGDRMDQDDIPPTAGRQRGRDFVDPAPPARGYEVDDDYRGSKYNDYFVPGTGIDREVIQHEICRYLGNDATVRPFTNKDGRQGYVVRAYRALTSAMIEDLKRDSLRWRTEQDKRSRSGRGTGSYAEMKGREEGTVERFAEPMDVDMDDLYDSRPARGGRHDVDPRAPAPTGRHPVAPVSSGYPPESGYYVSANQPGNYGPETLPRSHQDSYRNPGGSTPPTSRAGQPGYGQPGYPGRTSATVAPVSASSYADPRTGRIISGYEPSYAAAEPTGRRRHQER